MRPARPSQQRRTTGDHALDDAIFGDDQVRVLCADGAGRAVGSVGRLRGGDTVERASRY